MVLDLCSLVVVVVVVVVSGDENGDDSNCAAVWLYPFCQETRSSSTARMCCSTYGTG